MQSWIDLRSTILDEIISLDGPGEAQQDTCGSCLSRESTPLYCCLECSYGLLICGDCVVKSHKVLPLHRLEVCFLNCPFSNHTHMICSVGRMGFLTERPSTHSDSHWGQTPVFLVRTLREHCQEMHNVLRMFQPRTLQGNSEFTSQFTDNILSGTHAQYIQNVPGHVTAVFPLGKLWENSGFTE